MRVGVLGGGQLAQMLALAGVPIGIDVTSYDTTPGSPASYGGELVVGEFNDLDKIRSWAAGCHLITYEWENVPVELVSDLAASTLVLPGPNALAVVQDRWHEKRLLAELEIPVAPFRLCTNIGELEQALIELGPSVIVKTRTGGYDGKGQVTLREGDDLTLAGNLLSQQEVVVEQLIEFDFEASVISARSTNGNVVTYPTTLNVHRDGILRTSIVDTGLSHYQSVEASRFANTIMDRLDYVGVMALELFSANGRLIANEIAPRVHNSGHWTIEGCETSQFENHLRREFCGLPLGNTDAHCATAMVNIIGTPPDALGILDVPGASLHTYRKAPRPGRKLGHVTITANNNKALLSRLETVEQLVGH